MEFPLYEIQAQWQNLLLGHPRLGHLPLSDVPQLALDAGTITKSEETELVSIKPSDKIKKSYAVIIQNGLQLTQFFTHIG